MQKLFVYIMRCNNGHYYVGYTDNVEKRLSEHNQGIYSVYASRSLPLTLMRTEEYATKEEAVKRENQLKKWSVKKKEALMSGDLLMLKSLSKKTTRL